MRSLPLTKTLAGLGMSLMQRHGVEVPEKIADQKTEYLRIREAVGITDFSHMQKYRIPEAGAIDFLDGLLAGNVARTRFGRILHTFLADDDGNLVADCYVANNDEEFVLLCESLVDDERLNGILKSHGSETAGVENLTDTHVVISVDGFKAWAVVKELFGVDVLGLPYLSIETYPFENEKIRLFRCGKTSEFGYSLLAPVSIAQALLAKARASAESHGGGLCGVAIHNDLRLEGRFFNIFSEGQVVKDPLSLGLQWMIDFDKNAYCGSQAILARRAQGVSRKIIGLRSKAALNKGDEIFGPESPLGTIVTTCFSHALNAHVALALMPAEFAYSGLTLHHKSPRGPEVVTISMPPIMPKSLGVKLDEM